MRRFGPARLVLLGLFAALAGIPGAALHAFFHGAPKPLECGRDGPRPDGPVVCVHDEAPAHPAVCLGCAAAVKGLVARSTWGRSEEPPSRSPLTSLAESHRPSTDRCGGGGPRAPPPPSSL